MAEANYSDTTMGCRARDKVTGFEGIVVTKLECLFGCTQYGLSPKAADGKVGDTLYFDEGRLEILDTGVRPSEVRGSRPGGTQRDAPNGRV